MQKTETLNHDLDLKDVDAIPDIDATMDKSTDKRTIKTQVIMTSGSNMALFKDKKAKKKKLSVGNDVFQRMSNDNFSSGFKQQSSGASAGTSKISTAKNSTIM